MTFTGLHFKNGYATYDTTATYGGGCILASVSTVAVYNSSFTNCTASSATESTYPFGGAM